MEADGCRDRCALERAAAKSTSDPGRARRVARGSQRGDGGGHGLAPGPALRRRSARAPRGSCVSAIGSCGRSSRGVLRMLLGRYLDQIRASCGSRWASTASLRCMATPDGARPRRRDGHAPRCAADPGPALQPVALGSAHARGGERRARGRGGRRAGARRGIQPSSCASGPCARPTVKCLGTGLVSASPGGEAIRRRAVDGRARRRPAAPPRPSLAAGGEKCELRCWTLTDRAQAPYTNGSSPATSRRRGAAESRSETISSEAGRGH